MARIEGSEATQRIDQNVLNNNVTQPLAKKVEPLKYGTQAIDAVTKQVADMKLAQAPTAQTVKATQKQPVSYTRFDKTLDYMFNEMKTNSSSSTVRGIKAQLDYAYQLTHPKDWKESIANGLAMAGGANPNSLTTSALATWALKVRPNGDWDHKPKLDNMLGLKASKDYYFPVRGEGKHEIYYDAWSNIHYGYVGSAAGFDAKTLQEGAQAADGIAGRNDKVDEATTQIGIDLWNKYGSNMTKAQFHQELIKRLPDIMKAQQSQSFKQVIPINPNRPAQ